MELDWSTFFLEIINFLVLVWLLKHFLYEPVQKVVAERRSSIEAQLNEAQAAQEEADALRNQYENRIADWESEREEARQGLQREIDAERLKLQEELQKELNAERQKNAVLAERQFAELKREYETRALQLGGRFVSRLLEGVASQEVEAKLLALLLEELRVLPPAQRDALQPQGEGKTVPVAVLSAYPLDNEQRKQLQQRLEKLVPAMLLFEWREDRKLIAGLRVTVGPWVIHANLHDELKTFAAISNE